MSRTGAKALAKLRERLSPGGGPADGIILRRDLVETLVEDAEELMGLKARTKAAKKTSERC